MLLSVPTPNTSIRPGPHETAAGEDTTSGPSDSQPLQLLPCQAMCQIALSVPRTNTSSRLAAQDETTGEEPGAIPGGGAPGCGSWA